MSNVRLGYLIIYVPSVEQALTFYQAAFGLARRFLHPSGTYGELETGSTALAFADETTVPPIGVFRPHRPGELAAATEIGLVVDDVEAASARRWGDPSARRP